MDDTKKNFLDAEETATQLIKTLKELHGEATSYKTATEELNLVREKLLRLIESTEKVVENSHDLVKILKDIGGAEILDRLDKSKVLLENTGKTINQSYSMVKEFAEVGEPQIIEKLDKSKMLMETTGKTVDMSHAMVKELTEVGEPEILKRLRDLRMLLILTLSSLVLTIIISVIALIR